MSCSFKTTMVFLMAIIFLGCSKKSTPKSEPKKEPAPEPEQLVEWDNQPGLYQLSLKSSLKNQVGQLLMSIELDSHVLVETQQKESLHLCMHLLESTLKAQAEDAESTEEQVKAHELQLQQKVCAELEKGVLKELTFPENASSLLVGIWRTIFSGFQVSQAETNEVKKFEAKEVDGNGEYKVRYEKQEEGLWSKKKLAYTQGLYEGSVQSERHQQGPRPELLQSKGEIQVENKALKRSAFEEKIKVALAGAGYFSGETFFELVKKTKVKEKLSAPMPAETRTISAYSPWSSPLELGAMDAARMEGLTFAKVLKALEARFIDPRREKLWSKKDEEAAQKEDVEEAKEWTKDWSRYFAALPAFFRQQPETLKAAQKEIRAGSPATTSLIGGLSSSGIAEAQQILLTLALDETLDEQLREAAIRNLVQCNLPTEETFEAVMGLHDHAFLSRYSVFGTGIVIRKLEETGYKKQAEKGIKWLVGLLEQEKERTNRRDILRGIANSGHSYALKPMKKLLQAEDDAERAGALEAIRMIKKPEVDKLIVNHLNHEQESSESVREAAVQAASVREFKGELREGLIDAATNDPDTRVKTLSLRLLRSQALSDKSIEEILEKIDPRLKKANSV